MGTRLIIYTPSPLHSDYSSYAHGEGPMFNLSDSLVIFSLFFSFMLTVTGS